MFWALIYCRHKTCHPLPQRRRRDDGKERGPVFVTFYFVTAFMYAPQDEVNRNAEMFSLITLYSKSVTNLTKLKQFNFLSPPVIYFFDLYPPSLTLGNKPSNERKVMTLSLLSLCSTFFSPAWKYDLLTHTLRNEANTCKESFKVEGKIF